MNLRRLPVRLAVAAVACSLAAASARAQTTQPTDPALAGAIAERFAFAADAASADGANDASLRAAGALIELARRLKPDEIRFARTAADLWMRVGDRDRAIAALNGVRTIDPKDQLAMIQFVDLTLAGMETAEARQAYAQQIMSATAVPAEVRSHAAVQLMTAMSQRGLDVAALGALDQALVLNPQNATALETRYRVVAQTGQPSDRVAALMRLVEVAPNDPRHVVSLAQECTAAGDYRAAAMCYALGFNLVIGERQGLPPIDDVEDCVGAQMLGGVVEDAAALLAQMREVAPSEGRIYSLSLLLSQLTDAAPEALAPRVADGRGIYLAQLAGLSTLVRDAKSTAPAPATRPAPPMPDVTGDAAILVADDTRGLSTAYAVALSELLWYDLTFKAANVDDASLTALRKLIGDNDPLVTRLEGWRLLNAGSLEEAKVKFNAIADRDGFAKLGLAAAAAAQNDAATASRLAGEVLRSRPTGPFAAHVAVACHRYGVSVPTTNVAPDLARAAGQARDLVLQATNSARELYLLTADLSGVAFNFGEPMLARIKLLNVGTRPITIGPRGLIRPTFAIDTQTRGEGSRGFPATVVGKWGGPVRLTTRQWTSQVVRIDRGPLDALLRQYPTPVISLAAYVMTNPVPGPRGTTVTAGGEVAQIAGIFERRSAPLNVEPYRNGLLEQLKKGLPGERLGAAELIAAVLPELARQADNPAASAIRQQLQDALTGQAANDPDATTRAWISAYAARDDAATLARVAGEQGPDGAAAALTRAASMPKATRDQVARAASAAAGDPILAELAQAVAAMPDAPAAPPETPAAPSGAPAAPPRP